MTKFVPIDKRTHKNTKVKQGFDLSHAKSFHITSLTIHEFVSACHDFPILFVKDTETGQFRPIALMGLKPQQNLFYSEQGWRGDYVPDSLKAYPFLLSPDKNNPDQGVLCIDEDSELIDEVEGQALFDADGAQTEFTNQTGEFLAANDSREQITQLFIQGLLDNSLLISRTLELDLPEQENYNLTGLYVIDEKKLNELSDEAFLDLKNKGYLALIYAALMSLSRVNKLIRFSAQSN